MWDVSGDAAAAAACIGSVWSMMGNKVVEDGC